MLAIGWSGTIEERSPAPHSLTGTGFCVSVYPKFSRTACQQIEPTASTKLGYKHAVLGISIWNLSNFKLKAGSSRRDGMGKGSILRACSQFEPRLRKAAGQGCLLKKHIPKWRKFAPEILVFIQRWPIARAPLCCVPNLPSPVFSFCPSLSGSPLITSLPLVPSPTDSDARTKETRTFTGSTPDVDGCRTFQHLLPFL